MNYAEQFKEYTDAINASLERFLPDLDMPQKKLLDAMRYSLFNGGKRLRPVMLLDFTRMCGGDWKAALPFACALEMVHTYSLIHDDMPCMDNDDDRRGKLTCHKAFGESTALLAGSALLSSAFETMLDAPTGLPAERALRAAYIIARASGLHGIAGGQELDLHHNGGADEAYIHERKTAAMFIAAAEAGCVIADATEELTRQAADFGKMFGLGFQLADDHEDGGGIESSRVAAIASYEKAQELLRPFKEAPFLTQLIGKLSAQIEKGGN